jgi:hypothetical protein
LGIDESPALKERQTKASHAKMARPDFVAFQGMANLDQLPRAKALG